VTLDRWVNCGTFDGDDFNNGNGTKCNGITGVAGVEGFMNVQSTQVGGGTKDIAVRCCSDIQHDNGWEESIASVWYTDSDPSTNCPFGRSEFPDSVTNANTCYQAKNYREAEQICNDNNGRLCTKAEMAAGCTAQTGCNFDLFPVWTSDAV